MKERDEHRLAQLTVAIVLAEAVGAAVVLVAELVAVLVGVETVTPIEDVRSSRVEAEDVTTELEFNVESGEGSVRTEASDVEGVACGIKVVVSCKEERFFGPPDWFLPGRSGAEGERVGDAPALRREARCR